MKKQRHEELDFVVPTFSEKELILPPLRSSRNLSRQKHTLSPHRSPNISVNIYNSGGSQFFNRSPRFDDRKNNYEADSFSFKPESDFEVKRKRGASIGYGDKSDFTKQYERAPGVGRYQIPSVWDKYKWYRQFKNELRSFTPHFMYLRLFSLIFSNSFELNFCSYLLDTSFFADLLPREWMFFTDFDNLMSTFRALFLYVLILST